MIRKPEWLYTALVETDLQWDKGLKINFGKFLEKYSLHDSIYVGLFFNVAYGNDALLALHWDTFFLPERLKVNSELVEDWPYLFIYIKSVEDISTWDIKNDEWERVIDSAEYADTDGKKLIAINDAYGGKLQIVYTGETLFLAMNKYQTIMGI